MSAAKPPVAIRITRPYQTEEEFLAHELDTISRTGVTLVGAQPRPEGAVLRFELTLASGTPLLRGEGRVVGYKEATHGHEPGLSLRFTRLDSKSKALVDRVSAAKRSAPPGARRSAVPPPAPSSSANSLPEIPLSSSDVHAAAMPVAAPAPVSAPNATVASSSDREASLDRLRKRTLDPDAVAHILSEGARRRSR